MMMTVGVIVWVIFLAWLVSGLYPSQEMRRDPSGIGVFYSAWAILFGSLLVGQYCMMAQTGHAVLAMVSDVLAVGLGAVRLRVMWRYWEDARPGHSASSHYLHTHRS